MRRNIRGLVLRQNPSSVIIGCSLFLVSTFKLSSRAAVDEATSDFAIAVIESRLFEITCALFPVAADIAPENKFREIMAFRLCVDGSLHSAQM